MTFLISLIIAIIAVPALYGPAVIPHGVNRFSLLLVICLILLADTLLRDIRRAADRTLLLLCKKYFFAADGYFLPIPVINNR